MKKKDKTPPTDANKIKRFNHIYHKSKQAVQMLFYSSDFLYAGKSKNQNFS
jgi:hypothetical protein